MSSDIGSVPGENSSISIAVKVSLPRINYKSERKQIMCAISSNIKYPERI